MCFIVNLISILLAKPLNGQFYAFIGSEEVDKCVSFKWLKQHLHFETKSTILASGYCYESDSGKTILMHKIVPLLISGMAEEAIFHLLAAYPLLATSAYMYRCNLVAAVVHWHLMKVYSLQTHSRS